jgi:hypothetical protein
MAIEVVCSCGHKIRAREEHAGKRAKCPGCGTLLRIPGPLRATHDVFISYSTEDKPTADAMCAKLEAQGFRCWIAPRDILPGQDWGEAIISAIAEARVMVLVFSSHANRSVHVPREAERAVSRGRIIIPFRIEDMPPSKSMEYFLSSPHWLDALTPPLEKHLESLASTLRRLLSNKGPGPSAGRGNALVGPYSRTRRGEGRSYGRVGARQGPRSRPGLWPKADRTREAPPHG